MITNLQVICNALLNLKEEEISLEEALSKASSETGMRIEDNIEYIRSFLVEKNLIKFNSRLAFDMRERTSDNIEFAYKKIHDDFVTDYLTSKCLSLIDHNSLLKKLQEQ